jgi:adenylosuccinate synthase
LINPTGELLRKNGVEFGTTTGRPRRCGWLDLQLLRYSASINGYSALNVTKLDVLTGFPSIQVCTGYKLNGDLLAPSAFPASLEDLARVVPEYITLRGWSEDISKVREVSRLPVAAREYLEFIESSVGIPVMWVGVGPDREDMIFIQSSQ